MLESFASRAHGGAEVYGLLLGTHSGDEVHVEDFRAVAYESAMADAMPLSAEERSAFAAALSQSTHDRQGLQPVGWFRSHPHSELTLTQRDLEIANSFFPGAQQVVMILRPSDTLPTFVRFYYRKSDGPLDAGSPYTEFTVPLTRDAAPVAGFPAEQDTRTVPTPAPRLAEPPRAVVQPADAPQDIAEFYFGEPEAPARRRPKLFWPAIIAAAAGLLTMVYWLTRPAEALALRVFDTAGQLRILWEPVARSESGRLEIDDGGQRLSVELQPEQLRAGSFTYARRTANVSVRLVVTRRGSPIAEEARYAGREIPPAGLAPPATGSASREAPKTAAPARAKPPAELLVSVPVAPPPAPLKFTPPVAPAVRSANPSELAAPPLISERRPATVLPAAEPLSPPVEKPAPPPPALPAAGAHPSTAVSAPAAAPARPSAAPSSGRMIWIGRLQKNQELVITGKSSSTGTLIGELPGKPLKFSVSPGNLSSDGIVLYTANPQYANNVIESAGPQNGWNKTVYTLNPKSAADVTVREAPSLQNQWSRLVLQTRNPKTGVIVIDWTLIN